MAKLPIPVPPLLTHKHSKRCLTVKTTITVLIVIAILTGHWITWIIANLYWVWVDDD